MATSNLNRIITSLPDSNADCLRLSNIQDHRCYSSSSPTPIPLNSNSQEDDQSKIIEVANSVSGDLKIQIPSSSAEFKVSNNVGWDDPKTPTSMLNRIPVTTTCPPAPRKAKRVLTSGKRKTSFFHEVGSGDFMVYVDAMLAFNKAVYVPDIVVGDLGGAGNLVKRFKGIATSGS